jgi:hypothetical protein
MQVIIIIICTLTYWSPRGFTFTTDTYCYSPGQHRLSRVNYVLLSSAGRHLQLSSSVVEMMATVYDEQLFIFNEADKEAFYRHYLPKSAKL